MVTGPESGSPGRVKVLDFGLAKFTGRDSGAGLNDVTVTNVDAAPVDRQRIDHRHGQLHVAGTGAGEDGGPPVRHFLLRPGAVRNGHRPACVSIRLGHFDALLDPARRGPAHCRDGARCARRSGADHRPRAAERSRGSLAEHEGARGGAHGSEAKVRLGHAPDVGHGASARAVAPRTRHARRRNRPWPPWWRPPQSFWPRPEEASGGRCIGPVRRPCPKPCRRLPCRSPPRRIRRRRHPPPAPPADQPPADAVLTNQNILDMVDAKVSNALIINQIRSSKTRFNLSVPEVIRLSKAGVPDAVIEAMRNPTRAAPGGGVPRPTGAAQPVQPAPQNTPPPQNPAPSQPAAAQPAAPRHLRRRRPRSPLFLHRIPSRFPTACPSSSA